MAKTKFKYTVTFEVTSETEIKVKDVKSAVTNEIGYLSDSLDGVKVGKITVVAVQ